MKSGEAPKPKENKDNLQKDCLRIKLLTNIPIDAKLVSLKSHEGVVPKHSFCAWVFYSTIQEEPKMQWNALFFFNSVLLGVGLAMDAFSVSMANGLNEPTMKKGKMCCVAGVFAFFQALMPMIGWVCVHTILEHFQAFEKFIPWIALLMLGYVGGKMLQDGIKNNNEETDSPSVGLTALLIQGIATSIDALSVGFTIAEYGFVMALVSALIIAAVTFVICMVGLEIGKKFGTKLSNKATILGGVILLAIGLEIFITGVF